MDNRRWLYQIQRFWTAVKLEDGDGGDLIFAHKFKNFELELEWKVAKGSNSGILYLAQEVTSKGKDGNDVLEPIYISAPEYQILDNANHTGCKIG